MAEGEGDLLHALQSALRDAPNPLCIDFDRSAEEYLRSSNGVYSRRLPREDVVAIALLVKDLAGLDTSTPPRNQTGTFHLGNEQFTVNYCPQFDGEVLVIYRCEAAPKLPEW